MTEETARAAVYYPHLGVGSMELLKSGLLLWDQVEYITPFKDLPPSTPLGATEPEPQVRKAMELLLVPHVPTDEEKSVAHQALADMLNTHFVDRIHEIAQRDQSTYEIYPQKFNYETWQMLEDSRLAQLARSSSGSASDYSTPRVLGLVMMSVLADACAGTTKRTITDQEVAYAAARESMQTLISANSADESSHLVDVSLKIADIEDLDLEKLIDLREREIARTGGRSLGDLRHKFIERIDEYAKRLGARPRETDRIEIQRQFEQDMKTDLDNLRNEIGALSWKVIFSRDVAVGVLSGVGLLALPLGQLIAGAAALAGVAISYRRERKSALANHAMSWLYTAR